MVDFALKAADVVNNDAACSSLARDASQRIQVENGSEFISLALDQWAYEKGVRWTSCGQGNLR